MNLEKLAVVDPELTGYINEELGRQRNKIELIASENFVSSAVMEAVGTILTNKYAEGYPAHRYYGGCEYVDKVESLAIERVKKLFDCNFANVQPHSGSNTNTAVYLAFLQPGDTVMGMNLQQGGHLSHGSPVNISGKLYNIVPYGVDPETETIDYDKLEEIAKEVKPKMIVGGASAYPRIIDFKRMAEIAHSVGALLLIDMAHIAGLVAAGLHPSPFPWADIVTSTTHKTLRGPRGGIILTNNEEYAKKIDKAIFPGLQGGPLMHVIAGKACAFGEALKPDFKVYQQGILDNCQALADGLAQEGIRLVSGGTDNHLCLVDTRSVGLTGKDAERLLDDVGITCNKNTIPNDPASPFVTSGIRLGSAAGTSRGFNTEDFKEVAAIIALVLKNPSSEAAQAEAKARVAALCEKYPMYEGLDK
mgnify:FL=1